jgi:hypothetical protein
MLTSISEREAREGLLGAILFKAAPDMTADCGGDGNECP